MGDRASAHPLRWNLDLALDQRGADMADVPGGASGMLVRGLQGKGSRSAGDPHRPRRGLAGRRTARPGAPAAEELASGRRTRVEERDVIDASPAAITLALLETVKYNRSTNVHTGRT
jgi:hypothetical protein